MLQPQPAYAFLLFLAAIVEAFVIAVAWRRRTAPGARALIVLMISVMVWAVTYAVYWLVTDPAARRFWLDATYLGAATAPTAFFSFALEFTGRGAWLTRRHVAFLCVEPAVVLLALFTDNWHGLFYGGQRNSEVIFSGGLIFWINVVYTYGLIMIGIFLLARLFLNAPPLQRRQTGIILLGALWPVVGNVLGFLGFNPLKGFDLTPLTFAVTGAFLAYGLFRYSLFDLTPIARDVLIDDMSDGVLVLNVQLRIVDVNAAAQRLLDRTEAQLLGQPAFEVLETWPGVFGPIDQVPASIELPLPGQAARWADVRVSPLRDRRRSVQGYLVVLRDSTDRKRAEQALQQLNADLEAQVAARTAEIRAEKDKSETILRSVDDALSLANLDFQIQYVNEAFTLLTGYAAPEVLNQPINAVAAWIDSETTRLQMAEALHQRYPWRGEVTGRRKDGRAYDAILTVAPVADGLGQWMGYVISHQDITRRKDLDRARSRFLESVAHEFRTPLTNIKLYAMLLRSGARADKTAEYLQHLSTESDRLARLIQDSLDMAALDSGEVINDRQRVSLSILMRETEERYHDQALAAGVTLHVAPGDEMNTLADRVQLARALHEVMDNALTFTPRGGQVTLNARREIRNGAEWSVIAVTDTGPGLAVADQLRVFDRFYRGAAAASGHVPGSGLGLSIAQVIMRAHGGEITIESEVGRGSTFRLWLPVG